MMRTIFAVVAGFIAWTVLFLGSNSILSLTMPGSFKADGSTDSAAMLLLILLLSVIFSIIAGWITAKLATVNPQRNALILGIILLLVGISVQLQFWEVMPLWYHLSFLGLLIPGAIVGGRLSGATG